MKGQLIVAGAVLLAAGLVLVTDPRPGEGSGMRIVQAPPSVVPSPTMAAHQGMAETTSAPPPVPAQRAPAGITVVNGKYYLVTAGNDASAALVTKAAAAGSALKLTCGEDSGDAENRFSAAELRDYGGVAGARTIPPGRLFGVQPASTQLTCALTGPPGN